MDYVTNFDEVTDTFWEFFRVITYFYVNYPAKELY